MHQIQKEDKPLLQLLPVVTMWINHNAVLSEQELRSMARLHPQEFDYAKKTSIQDMYKIAEKYKDNRYYCDLISIIMSEKGKKWVEGAVDMCKRIEL